MDKYLDAATLREARVTLEIHGGTLADKSYVGGSGAKEVYNGGEYHPDYVIALRCIDRMIPRRVHEEYDTRLFQSRYNDGWREYQCPECRGALNDCVPEDETISDVIFYCPFCGQALEWEG